MHTQTVVRLRPGRAYHLVVVAEHSHSRLQPTMFILFEHHDSDTHTTITPTTPLKNPGPLSTLVCRLCSFLAVSSLLYFYFIGLLGEGGYSHTRTALWNQFTFDNRSGLVGLVLEAFAVCTRCSSIRYLTIWHRPAASTRVFGDVLSRPLSIPRQNKGDDHPNQILQTACDRAWCQTSES